MSDPDFNLPEAKIAIIGLGLMGGSLALGLRGKCAALYGIDPHRPTLELALSQGIVDQADSDPATLLPDADLVILSAPVPTILSLLEELPTFLQKPCIVMDLGSTKCRIVESMSRLPERFNPIGGHPICGKEKSGLEHAESNLFHNAPFILTPLDRTKPQAKSAARQIISAIGANLLEMTAEEHDRILAATSHLPFLLSSALVLSTSQDFGPFTGSGFRSTSRLAGTSSHIMMGILQSNRMNLLGALRGFQDVLVQIENALASKDNEKLEALLNEAQNKYRIFTQ